MMLAVGPPTMAIGRTLREEGKQRERRKCALGGLGLSPL